MAVLSLSQERTSAKAESVWLGGISTAESPTHAALKGVRKGQPRHTAALKASIIEPSSGLLPIVDQPEIHPEHKLIADEVLRALPESCRSVLKSFYVRYDNPEQRGLAGKSSVIVSGNVPDEEFRALLVHEIYGHVVDLGCLRGTPASGASAFKDGSEPIWNDDPSVAFYGISWTNEHVQKQGAKKADFVTGYASWDPFEDLAESVTYYVLNKEAFAERAKTNAVIQAKLDWIETHLFSSEKTLARGLSVWKGTVPWDATKLPYVWNGQAIARRP